MRKLILQIDLTLDGFIAGLDGDMRWVTADPQMNQDASDLLDTVDTILLGRVAYDMFAAYWPFVDTTEPKIESKIARQLNEATKLIFSKTLKQVEWGAWNNARLVQSNALDEISKLKAQSGKNLLLYAGADITSTFIRGSLIDEYRLRVHPVILGQGIPLFQRIEDQINLKLIQAKPYHNGAVLLVYRSNRLE